ncbi:radical SAM protein [Geosporobacter ferrireducens]|uniref:Radical SAM protein n=1 Tax=Geosporobacter ferrireducens TaxID=1424294 RepID=A0A1D8GDT5_9FIRM|nr:radical SAM protein [Geosporobacter ferrireducens]AOT69069.1 radical SAM protein [Geosporobacter ferrireducens]MTI56741.1 radical SAM protein [Geosporobacter ferrireducens]
MRQPSYLYLLKSGELEKRVLQLKEMLKDCVLCPHQCQVNRTAGEKGYCKTLENAVVSGAEPHFGEEKELVGDWGSGTIFFSHCNLKCVFCQNYEISYCGLGEEIDAHKLADLMLMLQRRRCHNINLVSPSHIIPQIVEAILIAANKGLQIPIVYNSNGYDLTDSLKFLDGIVDIYLPDLKFADDEKAYRYMGVKNYYTIAKEAIKEMYHQVGSVKADENDIAYQGLMIRHLVLPENLADTDKIMNFIAKELSKDTYVNIMAQYYPEHKAYSYPELSRGITKQEYRQAVSAAKAAGLQRLTHSL